MQARLVCESHWSKAVDVICLRQSDLPLVIGRGREADVRLNDRWVSRRHCEIDCRFGRLIVRDLDSRHGTMVNGEAVHQCALSPDDCLSIGMTTFRVEAPAHESSGRFETAGVI